MADKKFIKTFESHRESTRTEVKPVVETVKQVDDIYKVGSINIPQSLINSYVKKVKDETQKNLRQMYSDMEIAEELVKYAVDTHLNSDELPVSALLGGGGEESDDLGTDINGTEEEEILSDEPETEEDDLESSEDDFDLESDDETEGDLDLEEPGAEGDDEFEEPAETEEDEAPIEEEGDEDEEAELPI